MIVVDASALLEVLLRSESANPVEEILFGAGQTLHAPELLDIEVLQVLRRYEAAGELTRLRGSEALTDLVNFPITRYPHSILLPRIWELSTNLTAYGAAYVAFAEALDATLITRDQNVKNAPGHSAKVQLV